MLIGSRQSSVAPIASSRAEASAARPRASTSAKLSMPACAASLIVTTVRKLGTRAAHSTSPARVVASSGAISAIISAYADVLKRSAAINSLQPTLFSAYSSSASR
ncbi:hypothetical protein DO70_6451 [Burkholderia pseudomallei]|nr:hypothetical protein DO70_6451 [Burkholderia pseudomallei]